jgi:hypothetical protein
VKLLSYSIPEPSYNFKYSTLKYLIGDNIYSINVEQGYYNSNNLLSVLNKNKYLYFTYNYKKRIQISLKTNNIINGDELIELQHFELIETELSQKLGFINNKSHNNIIVANNLIDFRLPTKLKMYIMNIDTNPFSILNINGSSYGEINFKQPISLDNLHIIFKTENNEIYDFDGLYYNLSIQIITL